MCGNGLPQTKSFDVFILASSGVSIVINFPCPSVKGGKYKKELSEDTYNQQIRFPRILPGPALVGYAIPWNSVLAPALPALRLESPI